MTLIVNGVENSARFEHQTGESKLEAKFVDFS